MSINTGQTGQRASACPVNRISGTKSPPLSGYAYAVGSSQRERSGIMLEISFFTAELIFTLIWIIVRIIVWIRQKRIDWKRESVLLLMYINLAVIIRFVFFPKALENGHVQPLIYDPAAVFPLRVNLIPLVHLFDYDNSRDFVWNTVGNVTMFIPTGIVLPVVYKKLNSFGKVVAAGAFISLCIEILQLPFASRAYDIDDLILNTLGVIAGYGIYVFICHLTNCSKVRQA